MEKIKIARIVTVPIVYTHILDLLDFLNESDQFELHLICSEGPLLSELRQRLTKAVFHIVYIPRDIEIMSDVKCLWKLFKLFRKEQFDIIHSHTPKAGLVTALAGFLSRTKHRIHSFTGQVWVNMSGAKKILLSSLDKIIALLNTHNYADSMGQRNFLLEHGIGTPKTLTVIHKGSLGGINVERFDPERLKENIQNLRREVFPGYEGKVLLYLGRVNRDKGLNELKEAFFSLKKKYPLKLLLVGPLETLEDLAFKETVDGLKNDSDVTFINFTTTPELYLGLCDIFCFPSYREGFGTVALEASAMEKAIVASNIYGLSDAVADNETGLLFEVKNSDDLTKKLEKLLSDNDLAIRLGKQGRARVQKDFSNQILTKKLVEDYLKMVQEK
jgi:glycosyltransferase involved in cell wall biosynthesis